MTFLHGIVEIVFHVLILPAVSATPSQKYSGRTNAGQMVCNYGDTTKVSWKSQRTAPPEIAPYDQVHSLSRKFKYMFQKLSDKAAGTFFNSLVIFCNWRKLIFLNN